MICVTLVCAFKGDNWHVLSQMSGLVTNFSIGILSDIKNVVDIKLCMMVLFIDPNLFIALSVILPLIFEGHINVKQV